MSELVDLVCHTQECLVVMVMSELVDLVCYTQECLVVMVGCSQ